MRTITLSKATVAELQSAARDVLNVVYHDNATAAELRALIAQVHSTPTIDIPEAPGSHPAAVGGPTLAASGAVEFNGVRAQTDARGRVWISIPADEDSHNEPVALGVQGRIMLVPRGEVVPISLPYFEVLCNAIRRVPIVDRNFQITGWREVKAYAFSVYPPQQAAA